MAEPSYLFRRTYELIIGDPSTGDGLQIIGNEEDSQGLQLRFTVKKFLDNKQSDNTAEITLVNLAEKSIDFIKKEGIKIILKVGYNGDNKIIFAGDVSEIESNHKARDVDKETKIRCVPDSTVFYSPVISRTFPPNTSAKDILNYLTRQGSTISKAAFNSDNINKTFPFGYSVEGTAREILNEVSRDFNFNYRIDGKRLYVSDPNEYETQGAKERAALVSPTTGLIDTPVYASPDGKKIKNATTKKEGVKFKSLINPLLQPGQAVKLESSTISGTFRVNGIEFRGDWRGSDWSATCWCAIV